MYAGGSKTFNERTGRHERPDGTPMRRKNRKMRKKKQRMAGERFNENGNGTPIDKTQPYTPPSPITDGPNVYTGPRPMPSKPPIGGMPPSAPKPIQYPGDNIYRPGNPSPYPMPQVREDGPIDKTKRPRNRFYPTIQTFK